VARTIAATLREAAHSDFGSVPSGTARVSVWDYAPAPRAGDTSHTIPVAMIYKRHTGLQPRPWTR